VLHNEPPRDDAIRSIIRRYYIVSACYFFGPMFMFAVYPLFLRSRGLDQLQINSVVTAYVLMTFLTDVPTGAFADAVGRRAAVVVGCALHAAAFLIYFMAHRYWYFIVAAGADGLGTTFGNGPIDAWAIDALDAAGFEGPKDAIFSRKFQLGEITGMCGSLAGAYIGQANIAAPFMLNTFVWLAAGLVALGLMGRGTGRRNSPIRIVEEIRRRSIDSTVLGFAHRGVRLLSIAGLISASLWYGWGQEWQHYFNDGIHGGVGKVGWVSAAMILAQVAGLEVAARMPGAWDKRAWFIAAMSAVSSSAVIAAGIAGGRIWFALGAVMTALFAQGVLGPMAFAWFNEMIGGENRATLLSFGTTMSTLGAIIGLPVQGKMVDAFGTAATWQFAGAISLTSIGCYVALARSPVAREAEAAT
jgi:MFS family permease